MRAHILRVAVAALVGFGVLAVQPSGVKSGTLAAVPGACPSFTDPVLIPSNQTFWDFAFDTTCEHAFTVTPGVHQVQVLDLQTLTFEPPITVGAFPSSLDITPDGSTLYVTNHWEPSISVVDVATRQELRKITVPPSVFNDNPYSIAIANNGKALFSTSNPGTSGYSGRIMQLDLATDAVSAANGFSFASATQRTQLVASGDRSRIGIAMGGDSRGPVYVYTAATNSFTPENLINDDAYHIAADATGGRFLVSPNTPGFAHVIDSQANLLGTITGSGASLGIALDASGLVGYRADNSGIHVLNTTTFLEEGLIPVTGFQAGNMALSPDGAFVIVNTNGTGMWIVPLAGSKTTVVNSTGDDGDLNPGDGDCDTGDGVCTLRAALQEANATPGKDRITFTISTGQQTISPTTPLPEITEAVEIDGTTQPFFDQVPLINLDGGVVGGTSPGLSVSSGGSTIRGLRISNFANAPGIRLTGAGGNLIVRNFVGVSWFGSAAESNQHGIVVDGSNNNIIGGAAAQEQNLISGNSSDGVRIENSSGNVVKGNIIGLNRFGQTPAVANGIGVHIVDSTNTTVGGLAGGTGNTISGNVNGLVVEGGGSTGNLIQGNKIGVLQNGLYVAPNSGNGLLFMGASGNTIGGTQNAAGNIVANSGQEGIRLLNSSNNVVQGNHIGGYEIGNGSHGILIHTSGGGSTGNIIGGMAPGSANVIEFGGGDGVRVVGPQATGNTIRGNFIGFNAGKGIENMAEGNAEIAPPEVTNMTPLTGLALPGCIVDVFSTDDPYEGHILLGTVTPDATGNWSFSEPWQGPMLTATCTDESGNTSEFAKACDRNDSDCDGFTDGVDTCPEIDDPAQLDSDGDGAGDACERAGSGNVDCDDTVNAVDALKVLRHTAGLAVVQDEPCADIGTIIAAGLQGDVNCDGEVNAVDALLILRTVAELSVSLPQGCPVVRP